MNDDQHTDELMHYGVKGMRWGVRKDRRSSKSSGSSSNGEFKRSTPPVKKGGVSRVDDVPGPNGAFVRVQSNSTRGPHTTKGSEKQRPASDDAIMSAAIRHVARTNSISSLSNKELEIVTKRMNLEMNYQSALGKRYPPNPLIAAGRKFLKTELDLFAKGKQPKTIDIVSQLSNTNTPRHAKKK